MRKVPLVTNNIYHVFNRGVNKGEIFFSASDYKHFLSAAKHYLVKNSKYSYEKPFTSHNEPGSSALSSLQACKPRIGILGYCLIPNHFHFLIKQVSDKGIASYMQRFVNSYVHYINIKYKRVGPLFQGPFKGVLIESDEQFLHVSRYIHLNPLVSGIVSDLKNYPWSSYNSYIGDGEDGLSNPELILRNFKTKNDYEQFVLNQVDYAKSLEDMKHHILG